MSKMSENIELLQEIENELSRIFPMHLGVNKKNELVRLMFEICRRDFSRPGDVLAGFSKTQDVPDAKDGFFHKIKKYLVGIRYPSVKKDMKLHLLPINVPGDAGVCDEWDDAVSPQEIFVENVVSRNEWTLDFLSHFPLAKVTRIDGFKDIVKGVDHAGAVEKYNQRRKKIFLVRNKDAFIKICPCTKGYRRCGYWILNIGFGCPMDCSYCFLQLYSNAPGFILPANIDEYVEHVKDFDSKAAGRVRIGTGEFTDSLALDRYTGYSSRLIPAFGKCKNLTLELKTKHADIDNVLNESPNDNVVISWSVNVPDLADRYEKGGAPMKDRLNAAREAVKRGYKVGFHFDPIIYHRGWKDAYKNVVSDIFSNEAMRRNTLWISLGTLRYVPGLKQVAEQRFSDNNLYYDGEFFEDTDGKMRYPREIRLDIYRAMASSIKDMSPECWVYLCMEPEDMWRAAGVDLRTYNKG